MKKNLSHLIFWCCCCHETKAKKQGKKEQQKKQEKSQKETKKQGRTKKINKRKRETGNEKEKWRKPRRKKVRHWEMNKNNPFSGGKQCFCKQTNKKTKRNERFRANCPKTHVQGCVDPSWRRKRRKEQNTKRREGIFKRSLFKFAKTLSKKKHRKTSEKPSAPQPQADFWQRPESNPNRDGAVKTKTRQKLHKLGPARAKWEKRHFENLLGSAAPGLFLPSKTNLVKNSNFRKNKFVRRRKICVKNGLQHEGDTTGPTQINQAPQRKIAPKPLVLKGFASHYLLDCAWKSPDQKHTQKRKFVRTAKNDLDDLQNGIFEKPEKSENSEETWFPDTAKKTFRAIKTVVSKRGGRKWTHGGPQMNSRNPFWGAANEPSSIYIYRLIHLFFVRPCCQPARGYTSANVSQKMGTVLWCCVKVIVSEKRILKVIEGPSTRTGQLD